MAESKTKSKAQAQPQDQQSDSPAPLDNQPSPSVEVEEVALPNENEPALAPVDVIHRGSIAARFRNPDSEPYLFNVLDRLERTHKMAILSASVSNTDAFVRHKIALECLQEIRGTIAADADMGKRAGERLHRGK